MLDWNRALAVAQSDWAEPGSARNRRKTGVVQKNHFLRRCLVVVSTSARFVISEGGREGYPTRFDVAHTVNIEHAERELLWRQAVLVERPRDSVSDHRRRHEKCPHLLPSAVPGSTGCPP